MRKVVSIRLDDTVAAAARSQARRQNRSLSNYVEGLLRKDAQREGEAFANSPRPGVGQLIGIMRAHRAELERRGVRHAWIFGSAARGDGRPDSDIDVLVEVDPAVVSSLFEYGEIQQSLEEWMGCPVDVADKNRLRPTVAAEAEKDQILAF